MLNKSPDSQINDLETGEPEVVLEAAFIRMAAHVLSVLKCHHESARYLHQSLRRVFQGASSGINIISHPDYWSILEDHFDGEQLTSGAMRECLELHRRFSILPTESPDARTSTPPYSFGAAAPLMSAVVQLAQDRESLELSYDDVKTAYAHFRFTNNNPGPYALQPVKIWVPLLNLHSELSDIQLTDLLSLGRFTDADKLDLFGQAWQFSFGDDLRDCDGATLALRGSFNREYLKPRSPDVFAQARRCITALRLLRSGDLGANCLLTWCEASGQSSRARPEELSVTERRPHYLREADFPQLHLLLAALESPAAAKLDLALRRFNLSYSRTIPDDALLDNTIALEASLLAGIDTELKYRLAVRAAQLLSRERKPHETELLLRNVYDLRSKIVHDGVHLKDALPKCKGLPSSLRDPDALLEALQSLVRETLRTYLLRISNGETLAGINASLDERLIELCAGEVVDARVAGAIAVVVERERREKPLGPMDLHPDALDLRFGYLLRREAQLVPELGRAELFAEGGGLTKKGLEILHKVLFIP